MPLPPQFQKKGGAQPMQPKKPMVSMLAERIDASKTKPQPGKKPKPFAK